MFTVYKSQQPAPGIVGSAVVIIASGQRTTGVPYAEFHILLPCYQPPSLCISQRLGTEGTELPVSPETLCSVALEIAKNTLQHELEARFSQGKMPFLPAQVALIETDVSALRLLRYQGLCQSELDAIQYGITRCPELRQAIAALMSLPIISTTDISEVGIGKQQH
jgi:hypothetical protein